MYSTCLYCTRDLGSNEVVETLPIGRRLAFDAVQGRLWVVCRHCAKWNLVPFDTRLESIEAAERLFRDTRMRYSTDNIGLARLREGLELVRIGPALRPEFAAWRYGDTFGRRRNRALLYTGAAVAVGIGLASGVAWLGAGVAGLTGQFVQLPHAIMNRRVKVRLADVEGMPIEITGKMIESAKHVQYPDGSWAIRSKVVERMADGRRAPLSGGVEVEFDGPDAERVLAGMLAHLNALSGSRKAVRDAVDLVESYTDPTGLLRRADYFHVGDESGRLLTKMPTTWRLATEMTLHEESERAALAGELALLERQWREAERLAKIADGLALPETIDNDLARRRDVDR